MRRQLGARGKVFVSPRENCAESQSQTDDLEGARSQFRSVLGTVALTASASSLDPLNLHSLIFHIG